MDISLKREDYKILKANKENSVEEIVEAELSLPEYMPEILRIIKSTAEPKITACKLVGERVTVDGVCDLRMIYTAEDGCIYTFSQTRQFTRHCENPSFADAIDANAQITTSYVNCRATGTKRAEIKSGLLIKFNVYSPEIEEIISVDDGFSMEQKVKKIKALSLGCKKTRSFAMSDSITLDNPCAFIVSRRATAVLTEVRKISNKIMLRGEAVVDICYVNSDNRAHTERVIHSIPLNQILEIDGFEEKFFGDVSLRVTAVDVLQKGEQNNFTTSFDVSLGLDACVTMWDEKELCLICDAYCVDSDVELKKQSFVFLDCFNEIKDICICENSFSVTGEGIEEVLDICGEVAGVKSTLSDGELTLTGSLCLSLIVRDSANSLSNVNKVFDFSYKKALECESDSVFCEPEVSVLSVKCNVRNSNNVDIRAEISLSGYAIGKMFADVVTDIKVTENSSKGKRASVTVYFPNGENESLWGIARQYNTTVSAIAEENGLTGDTTEKTKILFIPSA